MIFFTLQSCFMQWDYSESKLNKYFSIAWIDHCSHRAITFSTSPNPGGMVLINCYVFAVGKNKDFIIVKQHPTENEFCNNPNLKITNYYIIENIRLLENKKYIVHGPLDLLGFEKMKSKLKIEDLEFTILYGESSC